jgi:hypothetical protein
MKMPLPPYLEDLRLTQIRHLGYQNFTNITIRPQSGLFSSIYLISLVKVAICRLLTSRKWGDFAFLSPKLRKGKGMHEVGH